MFSTRQLFSRGIEKGKAKLLNRGLSPLNFPRKAEAVTDVWSSSPPVRMTSSLQTHHSELDLGNALTSNGSICKSQSSVPVMHELSFVPESTENSSW